MTNNSYESKLIKLIQTSLDPQEAARFTLEAIREALNKIEPDNRCPLEPQVAINDRG